jgi:hypothetical protein
MLSNAFVLSVLVVCFVGFVQPAEDDYAEILLPGLAMPDLDDTKEMNIDAKADPTPCCFPNQFQGNITAQVRVSGGRRGNKKGGSKFGGKSNLLFVDSTNKRIAVRGTGGKFGNETWGIIVLFGANNTAKLFWIRFGSNCTRKDLPKAAFRPQCIPTNATYNGAFAIGPATGGLQVQEWGFRGKTPDNRGTKAFVSGRILVVPGSCIPVVIADQGMIVRKSTAPAYKGNQIRFEQEEEAEEEDDDDDNSLRAGRRGGRSFSFAAYFSNVQASIPDQSVFTPPSYCNTTVVDNDNEPLPDILERFISFD